MKKSRFSDGQIMEVLKQRMPGSQGPRPMSRAWRELGHVLQVACQVRRHGSFHDVAHEGARGRESASEVDVSGGKAQG